MLNVADTVDVSVDVNVAILCRKRTDRLGGLHFDARGFLDGARLIAYIIHDATSVQSQ